jgi:hypothetical protein
MMSIHIAVKCCCVWFFLHISGAAGAGELVKDPEWLARLQAVEVPQHGKVVFTREYVHPARLSGEELETKIAEQIEKDLSEEWPEHGPTIADRETWARARVLLMYAARRRKERSEFLFQDGGVDGPYQYRLTERNIIPRSELAARYGEASIQKYGLDREEVTAQDAESYVVETRHGETATRQLHRFPGGAASICELWRVHVSRALSFLGDYLKVVGASPSAHGPIPCATLETGPADEKAKIIEVVDPNLGDAVTRRELWVQIDRGAPNARFVVQDLYTMEDYRQVGEFWLPHKVTKISQPIRDPDRGSYPDPGRASVTTYVIEQFDVSLVPDPSSFVLPPAEGKTGVIDFRQGPPGVKIR